jgi:hypothetical protein
MVSTALTGTGRLALIFKLICAFVPGSAGDGSVRSTDGSETRHISIIEANNAINPGMTTASSARGPYIMPALSATRQTSVNI